MLFVQEILHQLTNLLLGREKVVVEDGDIELWGERDLVFSLVQPFFEGLLRLAAPVEQASPQLLHGGSLDEDGQGLVTIELLDVETAEHINIEDDGVALFPDAFHLTLQGAVELVGIHLLPFQKGVVVAMLVELLFVAYLFLVFIYNFYFNYFI